MQTYELCKQWLQQQRPELFWALNPRLYQDTDGWESTGVPAAYLGGTLSGAIAARADTTAVTWSAKDDTITLYICATAARLIEFGVPTYFVERDLATAVAKTEPPEDARWTDIRLPFPAGIFMLPRGMVVSADGYDYNYVTWCRVNAGRRIDFPGLEPLFFDNDLVIFSSSSISDPEFNGLAKAVGNPSSRQVGLGRDMEFKLSSNLTDTEQSVINILAHLALGLLRVLDACPELNTPRGQSKSALENDGLAKEVWTPHNVGPNYTRPEVKESLVKRIIKKLI